MQVFVPAGKDIGVDAELIEGSSDEVIDDLFDGLGVGLERGHGREDRAAGFCFTGVAIRRFLKRHRPWPRPTSPPDRR